MYNTDYETVAASQTDQVLGTTGTKGDVLERVLVIPGTTSPGVVSIKDGSAGGSITLFTGGAGSVATLTPFVIRVGARSTGAGGWRVTTGANVSVIAVGRFV
jgi:hypothetical protein